uniref:FMN hydroxy acid dehydrogenase domain-containing protein n=2 Tax=Heterosigma akashiwo TaxID=2829 RepID=A0A6V1QYU9_HETAK|mmetsp:Transcript_18684/g.32636  ORF Transcript_18684/g.32636 Transcript_18684/m.32636 type:complete len:394 (-) Transcript_18684:515-1696(-)
MSSFEPIGPASEAIKGPAKSGWEPVNVREYEAHAAEYMPKNAFDYYASGANDMITLRENRAAYQRLRMRPRILRDVSKVDISTTILGDKISSPICVAPSAMQRMAHEDGENATARACAKSGTLMTLSSWSTIALEEVAQAGAAAEPSAPRWFQLYVYKDRDVVLDLVRRAEAAGYKAFAVTVDTPVLGRREADVRNRFKLPTHLTMGNFASKGGAHASGTKDGGKDSGLAAYVAGLIDRTLNWEDIAWLKRNTFMKVVVKGVMTAEDARMACEANVDGIWVSNHGARQLDTCLATIEMVPEIVAAVNKRCEIYVDGGVLRGTDAFKALALGCTAVFIGRPVLWGLAHSGEEGVAHVLQLLRAEFEMAMQLNGCTRVGEIQRAMVCHASEFAKL